MREVIKMWGYTRMIMLTAVTAAIYAAVLIPFKGLVIIPGFATVRPANVFPVIFGIMFGPAGAWGSGFGNLISDIIGGTLNPASVFGFFGNFAFGLTSYKLWGNLGPISSEKEPNFRDSTVRQFVEYGIISLTASIIGATVIGWGVALLGLFPFSVFTTIVFLNNFLASIILGPVVLYLVYDRIRELGLLYPEIMREDDLPDASTTWSTAAAFGIVIVSIAWIIIGMGIGVVIQGNPIAASLGSTELSQSQSVFQIILGAISLLLLTIFSWLSADGLSNILRSESG